LNFLALRGKRIVVTRTRDQASEFSQRLEEHGAQVIEIPTIKIVPHFNPELDRALRNLDSYDWLLFTSVNGVEFFFQRFEELRTAFSQFPQICVIGPATADRVREKGFEVDLQPELYQAEGVIAEFEGMDPGVVSQLRILLPRARVAREILPARLSELGAQVDLIPVYDTLIPEQSRQQLNELLSVGPVDLITFTSSSTVRHFVELVDDISTLRRLRYGAIGPITASTALEHGLQVVVEAEKSTIPDFVASIVEYFSGAGR